MSETDLFVLVLVLVLVHKYTTFYPDHQNGDVDK